MMLALGVLLVAAQAVAEPFIPDMGPTEAGVADDTGPTLDRAVVDGATQEEDLGVAQDHGASADGTISPDSGTKKDDDGGCSCSMGRRSPGAGVLLALLGLGLVHLVRRRRS